MSLIKTLRQFRRYEGRIKFYDNFWSSFVLEYNVEYGWIKLDCKKVG